MKIKDEVIEISQFANIRIPPEEVESFVKEFANILSYMNKIGSTEIKHPEIKNSIIKHYAPLRVDRLDSKNRECPILIESEYYNVPKVIK